MNPHRLLLLFFLASLPSLAAAQPSQPVLGIEQVNLLIDRNEELMTRGYRGDIILEHKVNGKKVPVALTREEFKNLVVELVMLGELDAGEATAFIQAARAHTRLQLEKELVAEQKRLEALRTRLALQAGGNTIDWMREEGARRPIRGTMAGKLVPLRDLAALKGAERYDALIGKADQLIERGKAGDYILIHQVNGRRFPVAVTNAELEEIVGELRRLGEIEGGGDVRNFYDAAAIYTQNVVAELEASRGEWTEKRDNIRQYGDEEGETLARIAAEVNSPSAGIAERTAERARAMVTGTRGAGVMTPPVSFTPTPPSPPADTGLASWMTGTFDSGGGLMTLTPSGGNYQYSNGRMRVTSISGAVMEGIWEQDSSGQKCQDGRHYGKFRLTFTANGFSGLFGYCEDEPSAPGGFQGTRRK